MFIPSGGMASKCEKEERRIAKFEINVEKVLLNKVSSLNLKRLAWLDCLSLVILQKENRKRI